MNSTRVTKTHYLAFAVVLVVGIALRALYLSQPMRYDESLTFLKYASQSLQTVVSAYDEPNNHVFHSVLMHLAFHLFGSQPWALRLPAFIAGVLLIPALYVLTRMFYRPRAGLLAAGLCAVSLPLIEFSVNARGYTLVTLIVVCLLMVAKRLVDRSTARDWLAFSVLTALGFYTIPIMLYPLGVVSLWLALSYWRKYRGIEWIGRMVVLAMAGVLAGGLTLLLYLPIITKNSIDVLTRNEFVARPAAFDFYQHLGEILRILLEYPNGGFPTLMVLLLLTGMLIAVVLHRRVSGAGVSLGWGLFALLLILFVQRVIPFDRTWTVITPLYLMLAAAGLAFLSALGTPVFVLLMILGMAPAALGIVQSGAVLESGSTGRAPDAEAVALWLSEAYQLGDVVLIPTPYDEPVRYYLALHDAPEIDIRNQYQTYWVDLMRADAGSLYLYGVEEGDVNAFTGDLLLPPPTFAVGLETAAAFTETTIQTLTLHTFPVGVLYEDDFEGGALFAGWQVSGMNSELVKVGTDNDALSLATTNGWGELLLTGAQHWRDYAVELRVKTLISTEAAEDIYLHIRSTPDVGSYIAGYDVTHDHVFIGGDVQREWRGFLAETSMQLDAGEWHTLRFAVQGETLTLSIDGEQVAVVDDDVAQTGTIRVLVPPNSHILIDDLRVTQLDD